MSIYQMSLITTLALKPNKLFVLEFVMGACFSATLCVVVNQQVKRQRSAQPTLLKHARCFTKNRIDQRCLCPLHNI